VTALYDFGTRLAILAVVLSCTALAAWILAVAVVPLVRQLHREWRRARSMDRYQKQTERQVWR
jgi:hypothetical protein